MIMLAQLSFREYGIFEPTEFTPIGSKIKTTTILSNKLSLH